MKPKVLIVDDEEDMLDACREALEETEVEVTVEKSSPRALEMLKTRGFDLLISDIKMPELDGVQLMRAAKEAAPELGIILMTAYPKVETAVEALRSGAIDYVLKPFHPDALERSVVRALREIRLERENALLARQLEKPYRDTSILGSSPALHETLKHIDRFAPLPAEVLILGESGTGKELAARRLHARSGRKGRFVPLDCGAIPEALMENELFGHERGAYTDARSSSEGLIEFADKGTLFMDEICEMPPNMQAKLLRTLQERKFRRVGGRRLIPFDVRIISATNRDIEDEVKRSRFREDLYFRINSLQVDLPPLRERRGDIPLLAQKFIQTFAREFGRPVGGIDKAALRVLERYRWPGNIRQLKNVLKRAVALCESNRIGINDIQEKIVLHQQEEKGSESFVGHRNKVIEDFEKNYFRPLLERHDNNVKTAAQEAQIPLSSFYRFLKKHDIKT